jgi:hypothetical protein
LYFLFDIFGKVGLFGELLLTDALDGVDLVLCGFEFYFLDGEHKGKGAFAEPLEGVEVVLLEGLTAMPDLGVLYHCIIELYIITPRFSQFYSAFFGPPK